MASYTYRVEIAITMRNGAVETYHTDRGSAAEAIECARGHHRAADGTTIRIERLLLVPVRRNQYRPADGATWQPYRSYVVQGGDVRTISATPILRGNHDET